MTESGDWSWLAPVLARESDAGAKQVRDAAQWAWPQYAQRTLPSGEDVGEHVMGALAVLADLRLGHEALAAQVLWPLLDIEAGAARRIKDKFGAVILELAQGVQRMGAIRALGGRSAHPRAEEEAAQLEALRKMLLAMVQDVRVVLIKLEIGRAHV